ncbi:MAG TPA: M36 family metallopeptidase [Pyrinomonadaceae bacterium]|nr:M36 family metallopeptidase [Pyrinomonadaceae bacterium]
MKRLRPRFAAALALTVAACLLASAAREPRAAASAARTPNISIYKKNVPTLDPSLLAGAVRPPNAEQLAALDRFKGAYGQRASVRWNQFAGTPDVISGFHTEPSNDTPENTARAFVNGNAQLFGTTADSLVLTSQKEALGGYLLRFQQRAAGVDVAGGGLGFVLTADKRIRMVTGSTFRDVNITSATPALDAAAAVASVTSSLSQYAAVRPASAEQLLTPALDELQRQLAPALRAPRLNVVPTADGYRLAWNVQTFSRNPFGFFITQIDAATGETIARENLVRAQTGGDALPYTADIYPNHPTLKNPDTGELALDSKGEPDGLQRVQLRNYNPGTNATEVAGLMAGPHALVKNVLATQQPFAQAAGGTFHFRQNNAPLEAQPNESDDLAEPAEHIDEVNIFFFINYLLEYVDDIHRRDDLANSRLGQGKFPDTYPNSDRPLVGLAHMPDVFTALCEDADTPVQCYDQNDPVHAILGLDNAFSLPVVETVDTPAGPQTVVVNPTMYGHGYLLNDLGKDGAVAYHEGMHSISTPIAGLEGAPEGSALNEAQADLWAYTITNAEAIGEYSVKGKGYRQLLRERGRDPESLAYIRSVHSTLKYSQLGTEGGDAFEEHRDGEIFVATMWDLRDLFIKAWPQMQFLRPAFIDGQPTRQISLGQEMWERDFLGSLYILGLTAPDTFVKARDAMVEADRILYPSDPTDLDAPGQHEALIWQVYASHEIGANAQAPLGGRQTVSTAVPQLALDQPHLGAPQGVTVAPASSNTLRVSWQPVSGAFAYEVFKRRVGTAGQRQFKGVQDREYFDGDMQTTGWSHVGYTTATSFEDKGVVQEFFAPAGIRSTDDANGFNEMFGTEYAVRTINVNANRQMGFGDLSGSASLSYSLADVTSAIQATLSNASFANGKFEFDQTLKNNGVAGADATAYAPVDFRIISISNPTVTVANSDNGGDGKTKPASFIFNQTLAAGQTSAPRRFSFNDPGAQMFTFDAVVTARVRGASQPANGSQGYDGDGGGRREINLSTVSDTYTGLIVVGLAGANKVNGVDYVDVPFVAKPNSFGVTGSLDAVGGSVDLDFQLLDSQGRVLATSGNFGPQESVGSSIVPGRTYVYRVVGYANGPAQFTIKSDQYLLNADGSQTGSTSSAGFGTPLTGVSAPALRVRFTVNPLTKSVSTQILK